MKQRWGSGGGGNGGCGTLGAGCGSPGRGAGLGTVQEEMPQNLLHDAHVQGPGSHPLGGAGGPSLEPSLGIRKPFCARISAGCLQRLCVCVVCVRVVQKLMGN